MTRLTAICLFLLLGTADAARGEATIGVYFDNSGVTQSVTLGEGELVSSLVFYVVVQGLEEGITAHTFGVSYPEDDVLFASGNILGEGLDGCGFSIDIRDLSCSAGGCTGTPASGSIVLATLSFVLFPGDVSDFVVSAGAALDDRWVSPAVALCSQEEVVLTPATSAAGPGAAVVNPSPGVSDTGTSWGKIKSLYRAR